ncbi:MAG: hypothetical protein QJR14_04485 [Bacillota bacterium]|nr:hypothetical protein [Bacillota bacterium]
MGEIRLRLGPRVDPERDPARVAEALDRMEEDDRLDLLLEAADAHQLDPVVRVIEAKGFGYQPKGGHEREYHLLVGRDLTRPGNPGAPETPERER